MADVYHQYVEAAGNAMSDKYFQFDCKLFTVLFMRCCIASLVRQSLYSLYQAAFILIVKRVAIIAIGSFTDIKAVF